MAVMNSNLVEALKRKAIQAVDSKVFPGCVIGITRKSGETLVIPQGHFTYDDGASDVLENSIFDVASITKAIPTSTLALKLLGEGRLSLEDRVIDFVPEVENRHREEILIRHLLTQTLDYTFRLSEHKNKSPDEILKVIFKSELKCPPGKTYYYSNATSVLLGMVIERIYGDPLDVLGEKCFFDPLGMKDTAFNAKGLPKDRILPTEIDDWRGRIIQGEIHDESAYKLTMKGPVGSAGLFSTAPDLLKFLRMLLNEGDAEGVNLVSGKILNQVHKNALTGLSFVTGLGCELAQKKYMGEKSTPRTFGKTGFTGCVCICDLSLNAGVVILSNYSFPRRKPSMDAINFFRREIADIVFNELA
jgi:CubicO group peptidase (beta-lactamase class C family)